MRVARMMVWTCPAVGAAVLGCALSAVTALAQVGAPSGPGQAVTQPPAQCPATTSCTYSERNFLPAGYRVQKLDVCGANCTSQFWVSTIPDGALVLEVDPTRGGGIVAVGQGIGPAGSHPPVRTVMPAYAATDPACCPSGYADTTYTWDPGSGTLVAGQPAIVPTADFAGWDQVRTNLQNDKFFDVFP